MSELETQEPSYVHKIEIRGLWGRRNITLMLHKDVNIIVGPNASGKTTILNLLRYTLSADGIRLGEIAFDKIIVILKRFTGKGQTQISVEPTEKGFRFHISGERFDIDIEDRARYFHSRPSRVLINIRNKELVDRLAQLAPTVWLPVSRRLPIPEEEDEEFRTRRTSYLESVDVKLRDLLDGLSRYRLGLEAQLANKYKQFEKGVLQGILFSKYHDRMSSFKFEAFSGKEKTQLVSAFEAAGLMDPQIRKRIDQHFDEAEKAIARLAKGTEDEKGFSLDDLFIIPLIGRTKALAQLARQLEDERESLFAPLAKFEEIVDSFLVNKTIQVSEKGVVKIKSKSTNQEFLPLHLSSGEKQILILLTQALLWENRPVIYVADEPELSLHVTWQEKLLPSLQELGRQIQIIVATHSPDIVGPFRRNVIDLSEVQ